LCLLRFICSISCQMQFLAVIGSEASDPTRLEKY